jgi:hypothetical protein
MMASHTNGAGYSGDSGEQEVATPFNRPRPQWEMKSSLPVDPTTALLAEGGTLQMNDRDRAAMSDWFQANFDGRFKGGLHKWFQDSFKNQFQYQVSWWTTDWFPKFFAPIRDRINANFDKAFESIREHEEEVVRLRAENASLKKEMHDWVNKKDVEFGREVLKLRNDIQKDCALQTEVVVDMMADRVRRELASEIMKMQNEVVDLRRGFDVQKIVADAARVTEAGFTQLKKELAVEIAKSRDEAKREARRTAAAAKPTPAATKPTGSKKS